MAASASIIPSNPTATAKFCTTSTAATTPLSPPSVLKFPSISPNYPSTKPLISHSALPHFQHKPLSAVSPPNASTTPPPAATASTFHGVCYVVGDNIDTDQIIPAEYLTLVPSNPEEYKKLGSYALIGLPSSYQTRFVEPGQFKSNYSIVIGGDNFGCGSSREHAPVALGAAGVAAVVAESYARIFFRNSVATGEIYPLESEGRLCEECRTGDVVTIEVADNKLINHTTGKEYKLKPIGDAGPVIEAGGIFAYARKTGMIPA
ncbi:3-isopropylmalate dehydratase small subunit 1-like [Coffea arabica]|uniref:3-isopropylmalate dehydratase small subunit 1-like n=1 Tax=Coffea arabica TaxID=13443 RepID=A0ABM4VBR9_COFAR|nr:3-isopropylmalate dehydratase small subunit 3-like [Coffea arabica]